MNKKNGNSPHQCGFLPVTRGNVVVNKSELIMQTGGNVLLPPDVEHKAATTLGCHATTSMLALDMLCNLA